ncbi:MAG: DUF4105 domain-containing protein [Pseudomonadota bacterium]
MLAFLLVRFRQSLLTLVFLLIVGAPPALAVSLENYPKASIAFSAANLNDPESVFGHVFIVFHHAAHPEPDDPVVEFYGNLKDIDYAMVKTVISTVPGQYKFSTYADKLRLYDQEGRDVYVRPLRKEIAISDLKMKVNDALGHRFEYDFLNVNCAFYIELLLVQSDEVLRKGWRIRQPLDVYLDYGDREGEFVIRSADRLLAEFESVPDWQRNKKEGLEYFSAYKALVYSSVKSDLNQAARVLMTRSEPSSGVIAPRVSERRSNLYTAVSSGVLDVSYMAFNSENAWLTDPLPKPSQLEVAEVRARCSRHADEDCIFGVVLFNNRTLPASGWGKSKVLSSGVRIDQGPQANAQIGLGGGFGRVFELPVWLGMTPLAQVDTQFGGTLGLTASLLHVSSAFRTHLQLDSNPRHNPLDKTKITFSVTHQTTGLSVQWNDVDKGVLGYRLIF